MSVQQLLTVEDATRALGVSKETLRRLRRRGELTETRIGRGVRFTAADIDALIERGRVAR